MPRAPVAMRCSPIMLTPFARAAMTAVLADMARARTPLRPTPLVYRTSISESVEGRPTLRLKSRDRSARAPEADAAAATSMFWRELRRHHPKHRNMSCVTKTGDDFGRRDVSLVCNARIEGGG
eukprot:scaffold101675_cov33-Phaeocystis_antarctica.AAC.1